ncbi:MAG: hypothetical protein J07HQX50_01278 [Haloquadratum sp. J07HQX50]|nr:MAG: hypothetical protein J07HQX50_01278 [Haloquadratum sp. J07HQX50]
MTSQLHHSGTVSLNPSAWVPAASRSDLLNLGIRTTATRTDLDLSAFSRQNDGSVILDTDCDEFTSTR